MSLGMMSTTISSASPRLTMKLKLKFISRTRNASFFRTFCNSPTMEASPNPKFIPIPLYGRPAVYTSPIPHTEPQKPEHSAYQFPLPMGYTENYSPTFLSSGNPCLDFFFHVVPNTPAAEVRSRLKSAWDHDPLTALKLVCNLGGIRGTGKSDRVGFYTSALWIHENHPKTLATNVASLPIFGYFRYLPEILYRLMKGPDIRVTNARLPRWRNLDVPFKERRIQLCSTGLERYNNDADYNYLHNKITEVFAEHLRSDMEKLESRKFFDISLAAKWCPSLHSAYDNTTLLCEGIGRRLFPRDLYPEYQGIEEAHYAYQVRRRLKREVLKPLRRALELPEVFMTARRWDSVPYHRVPSVAMRNYKKSFLNHDRRRFEGFLDNVKQGKQKIAAGALLPHEIVSALEEDRNDEVAVLQWQRMVEDLTAEGKLKNCLAICDVSGSMTCDGGLPLQVSIALGLLVSDLSEEPWKGKLITFSRNPQLQIIQGNDLRAKFACIKRMDWEMNTDFQKVFDRILEVAKQENLTEEQMIKRLFVFSDMEFDQASLNPWETDYQAITRKFHEAGYLSVPEIVFWNLRNSKATPVPSHQTGVALVSGFSKNFLKLFLNQGGIVNPEAVMMQAISGEEYQKLVIVD